MSLLSAGICGAIAETLVGFSPGGCVVSIVVGLIGTYLGAALARYFNLPPFVMVNVDGQHVEVIWAILGAVVFLLAISLLRGRGRRRTW
jgi:uncharacterized membrane protein YeaQ/YmgE (transglycosylase-associated protein family)